MQRQDLTAILYNEFSSAVLGAHKECCCMRRKLSQKGYCYTSLYLGRPAPRSLAALLLHWAEAASNTKPTQATDNRQ